MCIIYVLYMSMCIHMCVYDAYIIYIHTHTHIVKIHGMRKK